MRVGYAYRGSNREAFTATTRARGIGIDELEAFPIQAVCKIQYGAQQVQQAFFIDEDLHALIFENLIGRIDLVVESEVVHQARASTAFYGNPNVVLVCSAFLYAQGGNSFFCFIRYLYHCRK